jgi:hypothetical protein
MTWRPLNGRGAYFFPELGQDQVVAVQTRGKFGLVGVGRYEFEDDSFLRVHHYDSPQSGYGKERKIIVRNSFLYYPKAGDDIDLILGLINDEPEELKSYGIKAKMLLSLRLGDARLIDELEKLAEKMVIQGHDEWWVRQVGLLRKLSNTAFGKGDTLRKKLLSIYA